MNLNMFNLCVFCGNIHIKEQLSFYGLIHYSKLIRIKLCAFLTFSVVNKINTSKRVVLPHPDLSHCGLNATIYYMLIVVGHFNTSICYLSFMSPFRFPLMSLMLCVNRHCTMYIIVHLSCIYLYIVLLD